MSNPLPPRPAGSSREAVFHQDNWQKANISNRPLDSSTVKWSRTTRGWVARTKPPNSGISSKWKQVQITTLFGDADYIGVKSFDGDSASGDERKIAKPLPARVQFGAEVGAPFTVTDDNNRTGPTGETQVMQPPFAVDDVLYVADCDYTGVIDYTSEGAPELTEMEASTEREWCHEVTIVSIGGTNVYAP
jgi:hypothetical protein